MHANVCGICLYTYIYTIHCIICFLNFEIQSHDVPMAGLELSEIYLPLHPKY